MAKAAENARDADAPLTLLNSLEADYQLSAVRSASFDVTGRIQVKSRPQDEQNIALYTVECVFEAHFHAHKNFAREHADRFADAEAKLVLWPYFRELVGNLTVRMGLQPAILPLVFRAIELPKTHASPRGRRTLASGERKTGKGARKSRAKTEVK